MKNSHGGNIKEFARQNSINKNDIIDFSSNVNWYGPPSNLLQLIKNNVEQVVYYPEITNTTLIGNLSKYYNLSVKNIIVGNGSAELIFLLLKILNVNTAYIVEPNFAEYRQAAVANNVKAVSLIGKERNNYKVSLHKLTEKISNNSVVFISNPNNPVGYVYTADELVLLVKELNKKNCYLFVDEAFIDFVNPGLCSSIIKEITENKNLIILRSLTKILAIPGLRLGILAADEKIISKIQLVQPPWAVNYFAQLIGEKIFDFTGFIEDSLKQINTEKERVISKLKKIKAIRIFNGEANFVFCKILKNKTANELQMFLSYKNIMIRNCGNYTCLDESYFRIATRRKDENNLLINSIAEFFSV